MMHTVPFVIAEIGVNHNGSIDIARQLIAEAHAIGADAVKFQTFDAVALASPSTPKVAYQERDSSSSSHFKMLSQLQLTDEQHRELADFAADLGVEFMSTPYGVSAVDLLERIGVRRYKTASADIVDLPLHQAIAETGRPVLIATGMASDAEIAEALAAYPDPQRSVTLMHAVSKYPTPLSEANVERVRTLATTFGLPVGYSDHTESWVAAAAATALGATAIEKHFTLDRSWVGPDHRASADPSTFREMLEIVNQVSTSLGTGDFGMQPEELDMALVSRKSLHVVRDMAAGVIVEECDLILRRPGTGLQWSQRSTVVGRQLSKSLPEGAIIRIEDFE